MTGGKNLHTVKSATIAFLNALWEENYAKNLQFIDRTPPVINLFDKFKGVPTVIVGAGPSLDRNVRFLQVAKGKSLIIACDAAVQTLIHNSVLPDIVVNLDPQPTIMNFFEGVETKNLALVAPTVAYPELRETWKGSFFFYNKNAPDIPSLARIALNHQHIGKLTPGGSVLSVTFDLAFKTGGNPIAFLGQDLSYSGDKGYASGGHFNDFGHEEIYHLGFENLTKEADIFGRELVTQKSMSVTNQWFNWAFKTMNKDNSRKIINCSESGILTGCETGTFSEFVSRYCVKKVNVPWIIKKTAR